MTEPGGVWLYAITRNELADDELGDVTGVAGEPLRIVRSSDLAAVVGLVDLEEFGEQAMRRNMENLDWLAVTARAHDGVVGAVMRRGPTIPLRLATVYLDKDRVAALLTARRAEFAATLRALSGRSEWGVKAYGDRRAMADPAPQPRPQEPARKGTDYLLRRRAELAAQRNLERSAAGRADAVHTALLRLAVDGKRREATHPVIAGTRAWMILNATYLIDDARAGDFAALVTRLDADAPGVTLQLTGPWPPYSFTEAHQAAR